HPRVALVTTDGFLYPNKVLEERGLMQRKGFPESYDRRRMLQFLADIKAGHRRVTAPIYSHQAYDIVPGAAQVVEQPDILIFEGLNVLQVDTLDRGHPPAVIVSDFFDFSIYVDAAIEDIEPWYINRFLALKASVFQDPASYFHHYRNLSDAEAREVAHNIWTSINLRNLLENILPTRERANVILRKRADHTIGDIRLRQICARRRRPAAARARGHPRRPAPGHRRAHGPLRTRAGGRPPARPARRPRRPVRRPVLSLRDELRPGRGRPHRRDRPRAYRPVAGLGLVAVAIGGTWMLLPAAIAIGAAYGLTNPAAAIVLGEHAPVERRGLFFSIKQTAVPLGIAVTGVVAPALYALLGWRGAVAA